MICQFYFYQFNFSKVIYLYFVLNGELFYLRHKKGKNLSDIPTYKINCRTNWFRYAFLENQSNLNLIYFAKNLFTNYIYIYIAGN